MVSWPGMPDIKATAVRNETKPFHIVSRRSRGLEGERVDVQDYLVLPLCTPYESKGLFAVRAMCDGLRMPSNVA